MVKSVEISFNGFDFTEIEVKFTRPKSEEYLFVDTPLVPTIGDGTFTPNKGSLKPISKNLICNGR